MPVISVSPFLSVAYLTSMHSWVTSGTESTCSSYAHVCTAERSVILLSQRKAKHSARYKPRQALLYQVASPGLARDFSFDCCPRYRYSLPAISEPGRQAEHGSRCWSDRCLERCITGRQPDQEGRRIAYRDRNISKAGNRAAAAGVA